MITRIWQIILMLAGLANYLAGFWYAINDRYDKGAYYTIVCLILWYIADKADEE